MATFKVIGKGEDGKYFDNDAFNDVINYVFSDYKIPHKCIGGYGVHIENAAEQMEIVTSVYNKNSGVRLRHFIISFSDADCISLPEAYQIADAAARYFADRHQIIFAIHEDTFHLHIHFVMNQVSYIDGLKYSGKKSEHYDFIYYMWNVCSQYGIDFIPVSDE